MIETKIRSISVLASSYFFFFRNQIHVTLRRIDLSNLQGLIYNIWILLYLKSMYMSICVCVGMCAQSRTPDLCVLSDIEIIHCWKLFEFCYKSRKYWFINLVLHIYQWLEVWDSNYCFPWGPVRDIKIVSMV